MKVIVDLCVVPIGVGIDLAPYVAACQQVLQQRGLKHQLGPNSTAIEGDWGPVMEAVKACHEVVHEMGAPRIFTSLKINSRTDRDQALEEKTAAVQQLARHESHECWCLQDCVRDVRVPVSYTHLTLPTKRIV